MFIIRNSFLTVYLSPFHLSYLLAPDGLFTAFICFFPYVLYRDVAILAFSEHGIDATSAFDQIVGIENGLFVRRITDYEDSVVILADGIIPFGRFED